MQTFFPLIIARTVQAVSSKFEQDVLLMRAHLVAVHSWDASIIMEGYPDIIFLSHTSFPAEGNVALKKKQEK